MAKTLIIEARTKSGERGAVRVECPQTLAEAVEMEGGGTAGELEVFKGYLRDKVIIWQREARPTVETDNGDDPKPKKRLSVFDRLNAS
jgi:hypothetical protein